MKVFQSGKVFIHLVFTRYEPDGTFSYRGTLRANGKEVLADEHPVLASV